VNSKKVEKQEMNRYVVIGLMFTLMASSSGRAIQAETEASRQQLREQLQTVFPGPHQMQLAKRIGQYTTVTKYWPKPDAGPIESIGSSTITGIMDGRFLLEESSATMTAQPASGMRIFGYNNSSQEYEASWVYAGSTEIISLRGTSADGDSTVNYAGTLSGPHDRKDPLSVSIHQINDDHFVVTLRIGASDSPDRSQCETTYTRKK
jgi:hypothetical protein